MSLKAINFTQYLVTMTYKNFKLALNIGDVSIIHVYITLVNGINGVHILSFC